METITTRQTGAQTIEVPLYPRLKSLRDEAAEHAGMIDRLESEMLRINGECQAGDRQSTTTGELVSWSERRAILSRQYEDCERGKKTAEQAKAEAESNFQEWANNFATLIHSRKTLSRELASAKDHDIDFVISDNPESQPRSKTDIQDRLLEVTKRLAIFSGDAGLMREYQSLEQTIADSRPYVTTTQPYVRLADGSVITEKRFNEKALIEGLKRAQSYCGAGARIPREEAQQYGII